jgi:hypothetical protein
MKEYLFRRTKAGAKPLQKHGSGNGLAIQVLCLQASRKKRASRLDMMLMMVDGMTAMTAMTAMTVAMRPSY